MMNFGALYHVIRPFTDSLIPTISEAINTGKTRLFEYSISAGLRYGSLYGLCIAALLASASSPFVKAFVSPQWHQAAVFLPFFAFWGYLIHPTHIAGSVLLGAGRPGVYSITIIVEQVIRLILMILLIPVYQFWGILLAYLFPIMIKNTLAWALIWKKVIRFKIYWCPVLVSPSLAALCVGLFTTLAGLWYWTLPQPWLEIFFCFNILFSLPLVFLFNGIMGGWDADGLEELQLAAKMTGVMRRPVSVLVGLARVGQFFSPLNRFGAIPIRSEAISPSESRIPLEKTGSK
jgi:O-antigen/teichoic acid export membrane protein